MTAPRSRRSLLRLGAATTLAFAGCSAPAAERSAAVPVFVDNRDDTDHEVRVWVDGTEGAFRAQFPVAAGALVKVTDVEAAEFCLHARVLELDGGELAECPAPDESDYSPNGYVVVVYPEPADDHGSRWLIRPVRSVESSAEPAGDAGERPRF